MAMFSQVLPVSQPRAESMSDVTVLQSSVSSRTRKKHWLQIAELLSLIGSGVGALIVLFSGRAAYGITPLTLALTFNVANRYRLQEQIYDTQDGLLEAHQSVGQMEKNAVRAILGMKQQLLGDISVLQHQLEQMPLEANQRAKQLAVLSQTVASIQDNVAIALEDIRQQVRQELITSQRTVQDNVQDSIQDMAGQMARIEQVIASMQSVESKTLISTEVNLPQMQTQLDQLTQESQEIIKPHLKRLILTVKQLHTASAKPSAEPPCPSPPKLN
ncbi:MAG: hypothetical protein ACRC8A_00205 [Microcoleaceae cyanobacterium]